MDIDYDAEYAMWVKEIRAMAPIFKEGYMTMEPDDDRLGPFRREITPIRYFSIERQPKELFHAAFLMSYPYLADELLELRPDLKQEYPESAMEKVTDLLYYGFNLRAVYDGMFDDVAPEAAIAFGKVGHFKQRLMWKEKPDLHTNGVRAFPGFDSLNYQDMAPAMPGGEFHDDVDADILEDLIEELH
jgi:hypothetical protein